MTLALSIVAVTICTLIVLRTPLPMLLRRREKLRRATVARIEAETARLLPQQAPTLDLAWIKDIEDNRDRVRVTYARAKAFIEFVVGYASKPSETHWEFLQEVKTKIEDLEPNLHVLTLLFEIAEYSDYPCPFEHSEQAISEAQTIFRELGKKLE